MNVAQPGGAPLEMDLGATGPGQYAGSFPLNGVGTYFVRAAEQRDGSAVGTAEAGLPVSYPAEFHQVTADTRRLDQIARAGGGHVLATPSAAFANDLGPISVPLPLQRLLLLVAAILLPLEVGLRRLRISPMDALEWLKHPHRLEMVLPWHRSGDAWHPGAWMPGAAALRRPPLRLNRPFYTEPTLKAYQSNCNLFFAIFLSMFVKKTTSYAMKN